MALSATSDAQSTWTGDFFGVWNQALNWSPNGIPNSPTAAANFTGNALGAINIYSNVQTQSLAFSNPAGSYTLTSDAGVSLNGVSLITVAPSVAALQTINLASVATGSLVFPSGNNLTITNNSTAAGASLLIGPSTVIATPGFGGVIVDGPGKTEISGLMSAPSPNRIIGGLTKNGTGTLVLSNAANTYGGGTTINGGTLMLGSGTAIPTGSNVTVQPGTTLNTGGLSNGSSSSSLNAIGTLTINGTGEFIVPTGSGDYWLNKLKMTDGMVDFTGTLNFWLHLVGADAGIITNASSTTANWIGDGASRIQNDTTTPLEIYVAKGSTPSGIDLEAGIRLSSAGTNPNFNKTGYGTMLLTNPGNTANITLEAGSLRVDDMAHLGSGVIKFNGTGRLQYGGPSTTTTKDITLGFVVGHVQVLTPGANLNYSGTISEANSAAFGVSGPGMGSVASTLTLNNNSAFTGFAWVFNNAILAIPTISDRGQPSPIGLGTYEDQITPGQILLGFTKYSGFAFDVDETSRGTLLLTGANVNYSTDRELVLQGNYDEQAGGAIGVQNASTNLTWTGRITSIDNVGGMRGSLIKNGPGTLTLTNTNNNYVGGTFVEAGRLHVSDDAALGIGAVTINPGATLRYNSNSTVARSIFLADGTLEAPDGVLFAYPSVLTGEGTVVGDLSNSGYVEPTGETGLLQIDGNYDQSSSGQLFIFADLYLQPDDHPSLEVTGNVELDGMLHMNLGGMGQFHGTRSFDILDWSGSLSGAFSTLQLPTNGGMLSWDTSQLYTAGVLTLIGPPLVGDYNNNGMIDAADYTVWRDALTVGSKTLINDPTPGTVDESDFTYWRDHFGQPQGSSAGADGAESATIPEPATLSSLGISLVLAAIAWTFRRRTPSLRLRRRAGGRLVPAHDLNGVVSPPHRLVTATHDRMWRVGATRILVAPFGNPSLIAHLRFAIGTAVCAAILLSSASVACAANKTWANAVTGSWTDATKWIGGVPIATDSTNFNKVGAYTVNFSNVFQDLNDMSVTAGTVTFERLTSPATLQIINASGGQDLTVSGATLNLGQALPVNMTVGDDTIINSGGTLNVRSGFLNTLDLNIDTGGTLVASNSGDITASGFTSIGVTAGSTGTATITGVGSSFSGFGLTVGGGGSGTMLIENGGLAGVSQVTIGSPPDSIGAMTVTGVGSLLTTGFFTVGLSGNGALNIGAGGVVASSRETIIGSQLLSYAGTGSATVQGTNSLLTTTRLRIGEFGTGVLTLSDGGRVRVDPYWIDNSDRQTIIGSGGILNIGAGGPTGTLDTGTLDNYGTLNFNHTDAIVVSTPITGTGYVYQNGAGDTTLTNASAFIGWLFSSGGHLILQNTLDAPLYTASTGGTIRFDGSTVNMSGTNAIRASGGTIEYSGATVNGGVLRGQLPAAGSHTILANASSTDFNGVIIQNSVDLIQNGGTVFANVTNGGRITNNAFLFYDGGTNTTSGNIIANSTLNTRDFTNYGQITVNSGGSVFHNFGNLASGGGSRITVNTGGSIHLMDDTELDLNGALLVNDGIVSGIVNVNYGSLAKGTGAYDIVNVNEGGVYSPGNSPGISTAASVAFQNGSFASGAPKIVMELGGTLLGTQYDQLDVIGQLSLGGTLAISLVGGFTPAAGNSFDILDWGSLTGTFNSLVLPTLAGLTWNTSQLYTTGVLSLVSAGLPGDYNGDGLIDAADYSVWRDALTSGGTALLNDPTPGSVDESDFAYWREHFGELFGSGSGQELSKVPEPASRVLLMLAAAGFWLRRVRSV